MRDKRLIILRNEPLLFWLIPLLSVLLTFGVIEIALRFVPSSLSKKAAVPERPRTYFVPEGSHDMADTPHETQKATNTFRISVVGDSFTFAPKMQFDDSFPKRIERWLNLNEQQPTIEVINLGSPGLSTKTELPIIKNAILADSDLIIWQVTLNDAETFPFSAAMRTKLFGEPSLRLPLFEHLRLAQWIYQRVHNTLSHSRYLHYYHQLYSDPTSWNNFSSSVKFGADLLKRSNLKTLVVIFPLFDFEFDANYPFIPEHKKMAELFSSLNLPVLDLRRTFSGLDHSRLTLIPGVDGHPNEIAHRIAAEAIMRALNRYQLIPTAALPKRLSQHRDEIRSRTRHWTRS